MRKRACSPKWPDIAEAARLMHNMIVADELVEFLTLPAYELWD